jgi:hypothetical protein
MTDNFDAATVDARKEIEDIEKCWWSTEPVPQGSKHVVLVFQDVTARHDPAEQETWAPENIIADGDESFDRALQRLRVQVNQKYRHPFLPVLDFEIVLEDVKASSQPGARLRYHQPPCRILSRFSTVRHR